MWENSGTQEGTVAVRGGRGEDERLPRWIPAPSLAEMLAP